MKFATCTARRHQAGDVLVCGPLKYKKLANRRRLLRGITYYVGTFKDCVWRVLGCGCHWTQYSCRWLSVCAQNCMLEQTCQNIGQRCYVAVEERQSFVYVLLIFVSAPFSRNVLWISIHMADMICYTAVGHFLPPPHQLLLRIPLLSFVSFMLIVSVESPRTYITT
jgi:hypothetical protein